MLATAGTSPLGLKYNAVTLHVYSQTHTCMYMYVYVYICVYVSMYVVYTDIYIYMKISFPKCNKRHSIKENGFKFQCPVNRSCFVEELLRNMEIYIYEELFSKTCYAPIPKSRLHWRCHVRRSCTGKALFINMYISMHLFIFEKLFSKT